MLKNSKGLNSKPVTTGVWAWPEWLCGRIHLPMQLEELLEDQSSSYIKPVSICTRGMWIDFMQEHKCQACSFQPHKPWLRSYLDKQWWTYSFQNSVDAAGTVDVAPITQIEEQEVKYNKTTMSLFSHQVLKGRWKGTQLQNTCTVIYKRVINLTSTQT